MSWLPFNWGIMRQPINWFVILSMLLIAMLAFDILARFYRNQIPTAQQES